MKDFEQVREPTGTFKVVHFRGKFHGEKRDVLCTPYPHLEMIVTTDETKVTCKMCLRILNAKKRSHLDGE